MRDLVVLKLGTSTITDENGALDDVALQRQVVQIADLHRDYRVAVVSSGAVAAGKQFITDFSGRTSHRKAAAAVGNPRVMGRYAELFAEYEITVAQILCERGTFSDRRHFLELQETLESLWEHNIVPIVNENDVISSYELRFSDNDELATHFAVGFGARRLLFGTSVDGVLDGERLVRSIDVFDESTYAMAHRKKSNLGLGGMVSKLSCAEKATRFGVEVIIFNACRDGNIIRANDKRVGTVCTAAESTLRSYQKWVAGIGVVFASLHIDDGAVDAVRQRKSLLAVGITSVDGAFEAGEVIEVRAQVDDELVAVARANMSSRDVDPATSPRGVVVAHADEIVVM
jgi:glutamate 5-kinase